MNYIIVLPVGYDQPSLYSTITAATTRLCLPDYQVLAVKDEAAVITSVDDVAEYILTHEETHVWFTLNIDRSEMKKLQSLLDKKVTSFISMISQESLDEDLDCAINHTLNRIVVHRIISESSEALETVQEAAKNLLDAPYSSEFHNSVNSIIDSTATLHNNIGVIKALRDGLI